MFLAAYKRDLLVCIYLPAPSYRTYLPQHTSRPATIILKPTKNFDNLSPTAMSLKHAPSQLEIFTIDILLDDQSRAHLC